jgi:hypothetical protein
MRWRIAGLVLAGLAVVYGIVCAGLYAAMRQPPAIFGAIMSKVPMPAMMILPFRPLWMTARAGQLRVADMAPDFELPTLDRSRTVRLSDEYRERPVVLIFGSYT